MNDCFRAHVQQKVRSTKIVAYSSFVQTVAKFAFDSLHITNNPTKAHRERKTPPRIEAEDVV